MNDFESRVLKGLKDGADCRLLGIAVSGGADSISLLTACCRLLEEKKIHAEKIFVITVNHFIRPDEETCGDAAFVMDYCEQLKNKGLAVCAELCELERNQVKECAELRGCGIEEAARFLRYGKFEEFISKNKLDYLCLAHNQNDQVETLLMRFLQGSSSGAGGIKIQRGKFLRPLLGISRNEIEAYLTSRSISWRTDSTNFDTEYLRNKIRHKLVPVLNDLFPGWQSAVLSGAEKQQNISEVMQALADKVEIRAYGECAAALEGGTQLEVGTAVSESGAAHETGAAGLAGGVTSETGAPAAEGAAALEGGAPAAECKLGTFMNCNLEIQIMVLLRMCNAVSETSRIPYAFLKSFCSELAASLKNGFCTDCSASGAAAGVEFRLSRRFADLELLADRNKIIVKKYVKTETDLCFFDIIETYGNYEFPFGVLSLQKAAEADNKKAVVYVNGENLMVQVMLPVCVRNIQSGDVVQTADGSCKKVSDVFSDWKVREDCKALIPVLQKVDSSQKILCILGCVAGFNNWIVKE